MLADTWRCAECGATYRSRPTKCRSCGSVVLDPADFDPDEPPAERQVRPVDPAGEGAEPQWHCEQCGRVHTFEPVTCVSCGAASFANTGPEPEDVPERVREIPPGFPTSPEAIRRDARNREYEEPVVLREIIWLVLLCVGFLVGVTVYLT